MGWIALADRHDRLFAPAGLEPGHQSLLDTGPNALMVRGSLVIETAVPIVRRLKPLLHYQGSGPFQFQLSVHALPGGGIAMVIAQDGQLFHEVLRHSETGRTDTVRLTYSWDAPKRWGRLALERSGQDRPILVDVPRPRPISTRDLETLFLGESGVLTAPDVEYVALSSRIEPVGILPSLASNTPVATPDGYHKIKDLRRGDLVLTAQGRSVPVLQTLHRAVPARGSFAPVHLRRPYFGLIRDVQVAPSQRLVLTGSEVEYVTGHQSVLVPARHLVSSCVSAPPVCGLLMHYCQVLLPDHDLLDVAGAEVESLFIGRIRRHRDMFDASILAGLDRQSLPEHRLSAYPVIKSFDAQVLLDQRAAQLLG